MRWFTKDKPPPKVGDYKVSKEFAFLPVRVGYEKIWFETVFAVRRLVRQEVEADYGYGPATVGSRYVWELVEYADSWMRAFAAVARLTEGDAHARAVASRA